VIAIIAILAALLLQRWFRQKIKQNGLSV